MCSTHCKNPSWWKRRTALEKALILISIVAVIAILALIIALVALALVTVVDSRRENSIEKTTATLEGSPGKNQDVCLTPGCIHAASRVLVAMDPEIEPCDDFYTFACGTFLKETNIPDEKVSVNTFMITLDRVKEQLRTLVSEESASNEAKPFRLAKDFFKACMNKTLIEERGLKPLKTIMDDLGGWPVDRGDAWDEKSWSWVEAVKKFRKYGYSVNYILVFLVGIDLKKSTQRIIILDQSALGISREYLIKGLDDKIVQAYYSYMVDLAVIYGAERSRAEKELNESLAFEIKLANISLPNEKRRNATTLYNPMTIAEVQKAYNYIDWLDYINAILPESLKVAEKETIIISVPSFFKDLEAVLKETPKRTIANYMMGRNFAISAFFLTEEVRKRQLEFTMAVSGKQQRGPRWQECVDATAGSFSIALGALYVRKHFREDAKKTALEMVNGIRSEFQKILTTVPWMDDKTRKAALAKAKAMTTHIGYPDEIMDNSKLEECYKDLKIDSSKFLESVLAVTVFGTDYAFNKLRQPVNKTDWLTRASPAIVNALYLALENSIQFPAGILQGQFFSADRPRYMNYGAIGFLIGHEITHGFDDQGRQFDLDGNLVDWWEPDTKKAYLEKASCIIDQYGNYTEPSTTLQLNGINTQGENIADNGGVKESYLAYQKWVEKNGPELKLPGLDYTPQQMFWISAAQTWCEVYRPEWMKIVIITNAHSPGRFRVNGPLSNLRAFAKDFNCPEGSPMNPTHKCEVW